MHHVPHRDAVPIELSGWCDTNSAQPRVSSLTLSYACITNACITNACISIDDRLPRSTTFLLLCFTSDIDLHFRATGALAFMPKCFLRVDSIHRCWGYIIPTCYASINTLCLNL